MVGSTSAGNEQLVRGAYEAYEAGDLARMLAVVDRDLEWTYLDPAFEDPEPAVCHGRRELQVALDRLAERGLAMHLEEVIGYGDRVLAVTVTPGVDEFRARPGDRSFTVLAVRDGRIVAMRACRDRREALEVLGRD